LTILRAAPRRTFAVDTSSSPPVSHTSMGANSESSPRRVAESKATRSMMSLRLFFGTKLKYETISSCFETCCNYTRHFKEGKFTADREDEKYIINIISKWDVKNSTRESDQYYHNHSLFTRSAGTIDEAAHETWVRAYNDLVAENLKIPEVRGMLLEEYYEKSCLVLANSTNSAAALAALSWYRMPVENPTLVNVFAKEVDAGASFVEAYSLAFGESPEISDRSMLCITSTYGSQMGPVDQTNYAEPPDDKYVDILQAALLFHNIKNGFAESSWKMSDLLSIKSHIANAGIWKCYAKVVKRVAGNTTGARNKMRACVSATVTRDSVRKGRFSKIARYDFEKLFKVFNRIGNLKLKRLQNPRVSSSVMGL